MTSCVPVLKKALGLAAELENRYFATSAKARVRRPAPCFNIQLIIDKLGNVL